jgi:hypothetical protein
VYVAKGTKRGDRNTYTVLVLQDETTPEWHDKLDQAVIYVRSRQLERWEEKEVLMMLGIVPTPEPERRVRKRDSNGQYQARRK